MTDPQLAGASLDGAAPEAAREAAADSQDATLFARFARERRESDFRAL
jgi:hypothetical protein